MRLFERCDASATRVPASPCRALDGRGFAVIGRVRVARGKARLPLARPAGETAGLPPAAAGYELPHHHTHLGLTAMRRGTYLSCFAKRSKQEKATRAKSAPRCPCCVVSQTKGRLSPSLLRFSLHGKPSPNFTSVVNTGGSIVLKVLLYFGLVHIPLHPNAVALFALCGFGLESPVAHRRGSGVRQMGLSFGSHAEAIAIRVRHQQARMGYLHVSQ